MNVCFSPEVEDDLYNLLEILVRKGYLGTYPFAISYVEDLVNDIQEHIYTKYKRKAPAYFSRYGRNLQYVIYTRNQHTTWYVFFEVIEDCYFVTYISNNHVIGHLLP